jgi:DNA-binding Xre family transcriptional regulator
MVETTSTYIIRNIELYHPNIARRAVKYYDGAEAEIIVELDDGSLYSYDDFNETIRRLPDLNSMSEDECLYEFGFRLRRLMYRKGITQEILSERTGIARPILSRYLTGKSCPSFYKVDKIAKALGCSIDELRLIK